MSSATYETLWLLRQGDDYHPLFEGRAILGRNEDVEVPLADPLASRQHAELDVTAAVVRIRDLGSRNGVQMRGRVLPAHAWVEMAAGEEIVIGTTRLVLLRERPRGRLVTHEKVRALPRPSPEEVERSTGAAAPYETFLAEADRAAARGDLERRQTATELLIETLAGALRQGFPPDHGAVSAAVNHALYLAEESGPEWVGRVFSLYRRGNLRVPIDVLARLEAIVIQRGLPEVGPLDAYLVWARSTIDPKDVRGVALLRQLERVRRLVGE